MERLIGNPDSVEDERGDKSIGYFDDKDFALQYADPEMKKDIDRVVLAYSNKGYVLEPKYAYYAWYEYSQSLCAHWLMLPKEDESIIPVTIKYLIKGVL